MSNEVIELAPRNNVLSVSHELITFTVREYLAMGRTVNFGGFRWEVRGCEEVTGGRFKCVARLTHGR